MRTAVITLRATDLIDEAREQMKLAEIRHIPVVDEHGRVVGIVSERDLRGAPHGKHRIIEVMQHPVEVVHTTTPAYEAAAIMLRLKIGSLPVVGGDEQLVGIITETDFLAVACEALGGAPAQP